MCSNYSCFWLKTTIKSLLHSKHDTSSTKISFWQKPLIVWWFLLRPLDKKKCGVTVTNLGYNCAKIAFRCWWKWSGSDGFGPFFQPIWYYNQNFVIFCVACVSLVRWPPTPTPAETNRDASAMKTICNRFTYDAFCVWSAQLNYNQICGQIGPFSWHTGVCFAGEGMQWVHSARPARISWSSGQLDDKSAWSLHYL